MTEESLNSERLCTDTNQTKAEERAILGEAWTARRYNDHGDQLLEKMDFAGAQACYRSALKISPSDGETNANLGAIELIQGNPIQAINYYRTALALNFNNPDVQYMLGSCFFETGDHIEATKTFHGILALDPKAAKTHLMLAFIDLLRGNFADGWRGYEYRLEAHPMLKRHFREPLWQGENLNGARILLHAEQGWGDALQFVRYVPRVAELGGEIVLEVPAALRCLLSDMPGVKELIARGEQWTGVSWQRSLMSLPLVFQTGLHTIPASIPYLKADGAGVKAWSDRIAGPDLKVGITWAASQAYPRNRLRSIPLAMLAPLGNIKGVSLYALQRGPAVAQLQEISGVMRLQDLDPYCYNLADFAAAIMALDLVITVDTLTAHLAGALGKPVWILLSYVPDWRWLLERSDSPWYPTARLFRQPAFGAWEPVVEQVQSELELLVQKDSQDEDELI